MTAAGAGVAAAAEWPCLVSLTGFGAHDFFFFFSLVLKSMASEARMVD